MNKTLQRLLNDRWLKYIIGISAFLFLITVLLSTQNRETTVAAYLFVASAVILLIRAGFVVSKKKTGEQATPKSHSDLIGMTMSLGFWVFLAVIVGPQFKFIWICYAFIALTALVYIATIFATKKTQEK